MAGCLAPFVPLASRPFPPTPLPPWTLEDLLHKHKGTDRKLDLIFRTSLTVLVAIALCLRMWNGGPQSVGRAAHGGGDDDDGDGDAAESEFSAALLISLPVCVMWVLTGPQIVKITSDYRLHAYLGLWFLADKVRRSRRNADHSLSRFRAPQQTNSRRGGANRRARGCCYVQKNKKNSRGLETGVE